jgi:hypothetical protein
VTALLDLPVNHEPPDAHMRLVDGNPASSRGPAGTSHRPAPNVPTFLPDPLLALASDVLDDT